MLVFVLGFGSSVVLLAFINPYSHSPCPIFSKVCIFRLSWQWFWLQVAVSIIEGYIILGGTEFLNMHTSSVAKLLDIIVGNVNDRGLISTLPVIELLIQVPDIQILQRMICLSCNSLVPFELEKRPIKISKASMRETSFVPLSALVTVVLLHHHYGSFLVLFHFHHGLFPRGDELVP